MTRVEDHDEIPTTIEQARVLLQQRPRSPALHIHFADLLRDASKLQEAAQHYQRAAELDPSLTDRVRPLVWDIFARISKSQLCRCVLSPPGHSVAIPAVYDAVATDRTERIGSMENARLVAAACADGNVRLYCATTGCMLQLLRGHEKSVTTVSWLQGDCAMLISGSLDTTARIWRRSKNGLFEADSRSPSRSSSWRSSERRGSQEAFRQGSCIGNQEENNSSCLVLKGHTGRVSCVAFCVHKEANAAGAVERRITAVTASTDQTVRLWCAKTGACRHVLIGHSALVSDIAITPGNSDSPVLVTSSGDAVFRVWDVRSGKLLQDVNWESGPVVLTGFLPSTRPQPSSSCGQDRILGHQYVTSNLDDRSAKAHVAPSDSPLLLTAHAQLVRSEARILLWDILDRRCGWLDGRLVAPTKSVDGLRGRPTAWDAIVTDDGEILVAVASTDGIGRIYDVTDTPVSWMTFPLGTIAGYSGTSLTKNGMPEDMPAWRAESLALTANANKSLVRFSPNGQWLAYSSPDHVIGVLNVEDGEHAAVLVGHESNIRRLMWLADEELLSASEDGTMRIWKLGERLLEVMDEIHA